MFEIDERPSLKIGMRPRERLLYAQHIKEIDYLVEFGAGGSTTFAFEKKVWCVLSIETDITYINKLLENDVINQMTAAGRLKMLHVDLGPCGQYGFPQTPPSKSVRRRYQIRSLEFVERVPEVVLIDGRYRLAVALRCILAFGTDTTLCFHDFWDRQSKYGRILDFTDVLAREDRLAVLRARPGLDRDAVLEAATAAEEDCW